MRVNISKQPTWNMNMIMTSRMLAYRIRSIQKVAWQGNGLTCLRLLDCTIYNLQTCRIPDMPPHQIRHFVGMMYAAQILAKQGCWMAMLELMSKVYSEVDDTPPQVHELPYSVRSVVEEVLTN